MLIECFNKEKIIAKVMIVVTFRKNRAIQELLVHFSVCIAYIYIYISQFKTKLKNKSPTETVEVDVLRMYIWR